MPSTKPECLGVRSHESGRRGRKNVLRVGIIGCGGIAERRHAPALAAMDRVRLVALADVSEERLGWLGERCGVPANGQYTNYESMLSAQELDIVHVCTPHDQHQAQTLAAMRSGAHVLVEKPIATAAEEADRMIAAAADTGRKLTVSHNQLFSAAHRAARSRIAAGDLGDIFLVRCEGFGGAHVVGRGANRDWRTQSHAGGGGPLIDNGYHWVYRAVDYTDSPARSVFARIGRHASDIEVEDTALVLIAHESGATTSIQVGWGSPGGSVRMEEVFGTAGQLRLDADSPVRLWRNATAEWEDVPVEPEGPDELGFPALVAAFVDAIESDGEVPVSAESSRHALAIVEAAYTSGRSGRSVAVA